MSLKPASLKLMIATEKEKKKSKEGQSRAAYSVVNEGIWANKLIKAMMRIQVS